MNRIETSCLLVGFTDEKTKKEILDIVREKLGEGINSLMLSDTIESMRDQIGTDIDEFDTNNELMEDLGASRT